MSHRRNICPLKAPTELFKRELEEPPPSRPGSGRQGAGQDGVPQAWALCVWMKERASSLDSLSGSWGFWDSCTTDAIPPLPEEAGHSSRCGERKSEERTQENRARDPRLPGTCDGNDSLWQPKPHPVTSSCLQIAFPTTQLLLLSASYWILSLLILLAYLSLLL